MVGRDVRAWIMKALAWTAVAYGLFDILTGKPEELWAFLLFMGVLSVGLTILFTIMRAKGGWWRRDEAKTLFAAKKGEKGG
ncbi:MAG TPA: hypothetical protein VF173_25230 [Thermoanaerobaculia bacterium]|nr:hypothetical protein [Thermoanaerobaculia bacterium]